MVDFWVIIGSLVILSGTIIALQKQRTTKRRVKLF